jgi:hypothetical protein
MLSKIQQVYNGICSSHVNSKVRAHTFCAHLGCNQNFFSANVGKPQTTTSQSIMTDESTERGANQESTERDADHEHDAFRSHSRSHGALLYDLTQLGEDDFDFFCDESFTLTPDEFWDIYDAHQAGEFPFKIGRYEYDGTTLYFKNITLVHGGVSGTLQTAIDHQLLPLYDHPEVG